MRHLLFRVRWFSLLSLVIFSAGPVPLHAAPRFTFETQTDLTDAMPQHDPLSIVIKDSAEQTAEGQLIHVQLSAPKSQALSTTDFPVVEGSTLFEANVGMENGTFEFSFVPPIRGRYELKVRPLTANYNLSETTSWSFAIPENPLKVKNLAVFLGILGLISALSGYVLGSTDARPAATASGKRNSPLQARVRPLAKGLVLAVILGTSLGADTAHAHGSESHGAKHSAGPMIVQSNDQSELKVELQVVTGSPRVGVPAKIIGALRNRSGQLIPARFQLRFTQLEHGSEVFAVQIVSPEGNFQWDGQFYDGSTHRIDLEALPLTADANTFGTRASRKTALNVDVEGLAPPVPAIAKSFIALMVFAALSMGLGFTIGRHRKSRVFA